MEIYYWNVQPNFGDLINPWLWPKVLPQIPLGIFAKTANCTVEAPGRTLLVGIGTLINERFPKCKRAVVLGAGVGYGSPPALGSDVEIHCVRGPLSAEKLSLPKGKGIIDPGILLKNYFSASESPRHKYSFMPQISSIINSHGIWERACEQLGFGYIDPRDPVDVSVRKIGETETLLTESMHGAIVAEALRVPWIPIATRKEILAFKWHDWCQSINIEYTPSYVTTLNEVERPTLRQNLKLRLSYPFAVSQLRKASKKKPSLSSDSVLNDRISQLEDTLERFQEDELLRLAKQ